MDDEVETLIVGVRADTAGFARDAAGLRASLEGAMGTGADRAAASIERGLERAVRTGKLGFEDLRRSALSALAGVAGGAIEGGLSSLLGKGGGGGLVGLGTKLLGAAIGLPGRATGGPVSPGAAYVVGERGPELFVPTAAGSIAPAAASGPREVRVSIAVHAPAGAEPRALERSSRQVARAVSAALARAER